MVNVTKKISSVWKTITAGKIINNNVNKNKTRMASNKLSPHKKKKPICLNTMVRFIVLGWSAGLMTMSYAGLMPKMDPTFIASVFTGTLATFGVDTIKKKEEEDEVKKDAAANSTVATTPAGPGPGRPRKSSAGDSEDSGTVIRRSDTPTA
jgi:hypothetical protein